MGLPKRQLDGAVQVADRGPEPFSPTQGSLSVIALIATPLHASPSLVSRFVFQCNTHGYLQSVRCSTTGPSARAGMNVKAPTRITVPTSSVTNSGVWVGRVPAETGTAFLPASEPAMANTGTISMNRATSI